MHRVCALQQEKPLQWEAHALQLELPPLTTTRENLRQKRRSSSARNKSLGWCKSNHDFYIVEICHLILEYILN